MGNVFHNNFDNALNIRNFIDKSNYALMIFIGKYRGSFYIYILIGIDIDLPYFHSDQAF